MCGVIVVDAGRSRSTNLGRDAYMHNLCLGYRHKLTEGNTYVYFAASPFPLQGKNQRSAQEVALGN